MAFKKGDKFILELGEERRMFGEFEIAGTDLYVKKDLLEKLTPYKPDEQPKTGHWVKVGGYATPGGDPVWQCSECGKGLHVYGVEHGTYGADVSDGQWVSCPNCGAVMNGGKNG